LQHPRLMRGKGVIRSTMVREGNGGTVLALNKNFTLRCNRQVLSEAVLLHEQYMYLKKHDRLTGMTITLGNICGALETQNYFFLLHSLPMHNPTCIILKTLKVVEPLPGTTNS